MLSGTWQSSLGAKFLLADDGMNVTITLISGDNLKTFSGKLTRDNKDPTSKTLEGNLDVVFIIDAHKRYTIHVTAKLTDKNNLELHFINWPVLTAFQESTDTYSENEIWTRQQ